jgi:simple sugar transport system ATP-binding protein
MSAVSCVYQHRTLVPDMTVAENLYLGVYENRPLVNWRSLNAKARTELERWEIPISPTQKVSELGVGEAQMIEIVRALAQGSRFVILDEPTAQLVSSEIETLMNRVNQLRERGVTFLFISHHLDEVPQVCDAVTVLRNGTDVLQDGPRTSSPAPSGARHGWPRRRRSPVLTR